MNISLVIPCYNEAKNIPLLLERCNKLAEHPNIEIILVNNGSTDQTQQIFDELLPRYPHCRCVHLQHNQGYGFGILAGLQAATGQILGWTHADLQTDPVDLLKGLDYFNNTDTSIFVKGKRYGRPLSDILFTISMSFFETLLLRKRLWDINAQPTLFSRSFFETWHEPPHDFALDLYAYYHACRLGLPVYRFPVLFDKRIHGTSHWNINWAAKRKFIRRTVLFSLQLKRALI